MATYCDDECELSGGICDFCVHYIDDSVKDGGTFAGEGWCDAKKERVDACYGCDDDFYCRLAKEAKQV